jgi:RNA polymerase sigma-70 factor (ECF subfamily)
MAIKKDAWENIYKNLLPRVFNYFRYRLNDGYVAEELTSITFEKAWKARRRYEKDKGSFSTWIFTIARNTATDYLRKQGEEIELDAKNVKADLISTEEIYEKREEAHHLIEILSILDNREKELIGLKYGADLTNRKIAEITGLTETNVGTILHRTINKLSEEWEEDKDER